MESVHGAPHDGLPQEGARTQIAMRPIDQGFR